MQAKDIETKLHKFISTWTQKYKFIIKTLPPDHGKENGERQCFMAEFSKLSPDKPIAETSLRVFFYLPKGSSDVADLTFRFEHDQLLHKINSTIKYEDMEKFIEMHINYRCQIKMTYFLATSFEKTRVADSRIDLLPKKVEIVEKIAEEFVIKNPATFESRKIIPNFFKSKIELSNLTLLHELHRSIESAYGFSVSEFNSTKTINDYTKLFGINITEGKFWLEHLEVKPATGKGFISQAILAPFLRELTFSKLIFEVIYAKAAETIRLAKIRAVEIVKKRFFIIFDEVQQILNSIILNNNMHMGAVKQLLKGLSEKFLSAMEIEEIERRFRPEQITPDAIRNLKQIIFEVKIAGFLRKYLAVSEAPVFKDLLMDAAGKGLTTLTKDNFEDFMKENSRVSMVKRQIWFLFSFLESRGLVRNGHLFFDEYFIVVSRYIQALVENKQFMVDFVNSNVPEGDNQIIFPDQNLQTDVFSMLKVANATEMQTIFAKKLKFFKVPGDSLNDLFTELSMLKSKPGFRVEDPCAVKTLILQHSFTLASEHFLLSDG